MSKIVSIKEQSFDKKAEAKYPSYDGFVVTLDDGTVLKMGIHNGTCCCENWGYLMSNDDLSDFIGADFISVAGVDAELKHYDVPAVYEGSAMFINIETSAGLLQFVAYNEHNGYYSHDAVLIENGTTTLTEYL